MEALEDCAAWIEAHPDEVALGVATLMGAMDRNAEDRGAPVKDSKVQRRAKEKMLVKAITQSPTLLKDMVTKAKGGGVKAVMKDGERMRHRAPQKNYVPVEDNGLFEGREWKKVNAGHHEPIEIIRPKESPYYSSSFQAQLKKGIHFPGKPDRTHFQEANKQLHLELSSNPDLKANFEKLYPGITDFLKPSAKGAYSSKPPVQFGLTWHHNSYIPGMMDLVPRLHHRAPGNVQHNLHPEQKGGMEIWGGGRKSAQKKGDSHE